MCLVGLTSVNAKINAVVTEMPDEALSEAHRVDDAIAGGDDLAPEGLQVAPEVEAAVRGARRRLEDDGWIVDEVEIPPLREAARHHARLWLADFRYDNRGVVEREDDPDASFVFAQMGAVPTAGS